DPCTEQVRIDRGHGIQDAQQARRGIALTNGMHEVSSGRRRHIDRDDVVLAGQREETIEHVLAYAEPELLELCRHATSPRLVLHQYAGSAHAPSVFLAGARLDIARA